MREFLRILLFLRLKVYMHFLSSIAFEPQDLGQMFWVTFHKLLTVLCWNSGVKKKNSVRLAGRLTRIRLFRSAHKLG